MRQVMIGLCAMDTTIQDAEIPTTAQEQPIEHDQTPAPVPSDKSPHDFYVEITKRPDVRAVLEELATN
jgi:hypothetical protein